MASEVIENIKEVNNEKIEEQEELKSKSLEVLEEKPKKVTSKKTRTKKFYSGDLVYIINGAQFKDGTDVPLWLMQRPVYVQKKMDSTLCKIGINQSGSPIYFIDSCYLTHTK